MLRLRHQGQLPLVKGQRLRSEGLVPSFIARSGRWTGTWLGFQPTQDQQRLLRHLKAKVAMRVDP